MWSAAAAWPLEVRACSLQACCWRADRHAPHLAHVPVAIITSSPAAKDKARTSGKLGGNSPEEGGKLCVIIRWPVFQTDWP